MYVSGLRILYRRGLGVGVLDAYDYSTKSDLPSATTSADLFMDSCGFHYVFCFDIHFQSQKPR